MKELADDLKAIGEHLGHAHDLAFLAERLSTITNRRGKRGQRILSGLIDARQKELQRIAIALAEKFYARRSKQFADRISEYFTGVGGGTVSLVSEGDCAERRLAQSRRRGVMLMPDVLGRRSVNSILRHVGGVITDPFKTTRNKNQIQIPT